jgi:hypothetical protein
MQRKIDTHFLIISPYKNNANTGKTPWIKIVYTSLDPLRSLHTYMKQAPPPPELTCVKPVG